MSGSFLSQLHAHTSIPETTLRTLGRDLGGLSIDSLTRVAEGYANEVYVATTEHQRDIVIRIQLRGRMSFEQETWAMEQCRLATLPVPQVLGVTTWEDARGNHDLMTIEKAPGRPLADVMDTLNTEQLRTVFGHIGAALQIMHGITVEHFGPIGAGATSSWADYVRETMDARRADTIAAIAAGLTQPETDSVLAIIGHLKEISCEMPSLCHGDISADHLFIDEALNLSGIIDFGMCQGGPGALDLAVLTMFHPNVQLDWLWRGYAHGQDIPAMYPRDILACQANVAMTYLAHDFRLGNTDSREVVLGGLRSILGTWSSMESRTVIPPVGDASGG